MSKSAKKNFFKLKGALGPFWQGGGYGHSNTLYCLQKSKYLKIRKINKKCFCILDKIKYFEVINNLLRKHFILKLAMLVT